MNSELLVIMARYPTVGKVKTRLAAGMGHRAATDLYRSFLDRIAAEFARVPFAVEWRYTPRQAPFRRIIGNDCAIRPQPDGDLGARMRRIFEESFADGRERVVIIGSDAPMLNRSTVARAFRLLRRQDAVVQPTEDGGYALIGLAGPWDVFSGVAWSTDRVTGQTRQRLRRLGLSFTELPATFDVDTAADLAKLKSITEEP
jgi:rSAM/selenodomain-associated transferase 1